MKVLILLLALAPQEEPPHRHVPTQQYPVPDWIHDPNLREFLKEEIRSGRLTDLFPRGADREKMLRWLKGHLKNGGSQNPSESRWSTWPWPSRSTSAAG